MQIGRLCLAAAIAGAVTSPVLAAETVPVPAFRGIKLSGGGTAILRPGPVQRVTIINGSTHYTDVQVNSRGELVIDTCGNARCPRRYNLQVEIQTPGIEAVAVSGGGDIVARPGFSTQRSLAASVSGGGGADLRALPVSDLVANVSGGGDLRVRPSASLTANVSGGGDITYWGNPAVTSRTSGGGSISKAD